MSILANACCCNVTPDSCGTCLQLLFGDAIETICCRNTQEKVCIVIKRPARESILCMSVPSGPCAGTVTLTKNWDERSDLIAVYEYDTCLWAFERDVTVPPETDPCTGGGGSQACGSVYSLFGTGLWSEYRNDTMAADPLGRWWADIQCYNGGDYITFAMWPYTPTDTEGNRGTNDGSTYYLIDYYLCTVHRRITWQRACDSGNFGTGNESVDCIVPGSVSFTGSGAPVFEFDLLAATDATRWGSQALSYTAAQNFIVAIRNGVEPSQADCDTINAHPANIFKTHDWRPEQTASDAFLATLYPTEYGPCGPQTDPLAPCVKHCWPAIQPELVVAAVASLQADCLPTPTPSMEADPAWVIRRNTYFRPRPAGWSYECSGEGSCDDPTWSGECFRYDGAPFGEPSCSASGPSCPGCDYCTGDGCPPMIGISPCTSELACSYKMVSASCDGLFLSYAVTEFSSCETFQTCVAQPPGYDCTEAICQDYLLYRCYQNYAYLFTVNRGCEAYSDPIRCLAADPPVNTQPMLDSISGISMLVRPHARNILLALDGGDCTNSGHQCADCTDACGYVGTPVPVSQVAAAPCGTFVLDGAPEVYDACLDVCWTADPCEPACVWPSGTLECLDPIPTDPCA